MDVEARASRSQALPGNALPRGSASRVRASADGLSPGVAFARQSLAGSAFPGGAWERGGGGFRACIGGGLGYPISHPQPGARAGGSEAGCVPPQFGDLPCVTLSPSHWLFPASPACLSRKRPRKRRWPPRSFCNRRTARTSYDLAKLVEKGPVLVRLTCACTGCDAELAFFQKLQAAYQDKGLQTIAVFSEKPEAVETYAVKKNINFMWLSDPKATLWKTFEAKTMPTNILIEKGGKVSAWSPAARRMAAMPATVGRSGEDAENGCGQDRGAQGEEDEVRAAACGLASGHAKPQAGYLRNASSSAISGETLSAMYDSQPSANLCSLVLSMRVRSVASARSKAWAKQYCRVCGVTMAWRGSRLSQST